VPKKSENGWTSVCEKCKKPVGELVFERKGMLVCKRCVDKIDGKVREAPEPEE
jgi:hypothetical protein